LTEAKFPILTGEIWRKSLTKARERRRLRGEELKQFLKNIMNNTSIKKSSYDWLKESNYSSITILYHKGWDLKNFKQSMEEMITEEEFNRRIILSRIQAPRVLNEFTD
jgi:hypothetical protein